MSIAVKCPTCGKVYSVNEQFAGKKAKCTACSGTMVVPQAVVEPNPFGEETSPFELAVSPPISSPPPVPTMSRQPDFAAPLVKTKTATGFRPGFRLNRLTVAMVAGGIVLIFLGVKESRLAAAAKSTPQEITCLQLEKNGPGDNAYVHVTGLIPTVNFVYEQRNGSSSDWSQVWQPVIPIDGAFMSAVKMKSLFGQINSNSDIPVPDKIRIIVKSNKIHNQGDLSAFSRAKNVQGMVINKVDSLSEKELKILRGSYPSTDFTKCWIIEDGREPASMGKYAMLFGGGSVLALLGLVLIFKPN